MNESSDHNQPPHDPDSRQDVPDASKDQFLYPQSRYRGEFSPERLAFNSNLQEFAQRVAIICNFETSGKISSDDAYQQIKTLWKQLKRSKKEFLEN